MDDSLERRVEKLESDSVSTRNLLGELFVLQVKSMTVMRKHLIKLGLDPDKLSQNGTGG